MTYKRDPNTIPSPLPADYDRQFDFSDFQAGNPLTPLPGVPLDNEFNAIERSLDETQSRLELIQRDDGALKNASVGIDQLKTEARIGVNAPESWAPSKAYAVNESVIVDGGTWYVALQSHISTADFAADLAAGRWRLLINLTPFTTEAKNWATLAEDAPVPAGNGTQFSAFHYSEKSETAKTAAQAARDVTTAARDTATAARDAAQLAQSESEVSRINSESSAVASSGFADDSAASAVSAAASYDDFDDRYLGPKASAPATDNDGDPLTDGVLYFDTTDKRMKVYDSTLGQFKNAGSTVDALYQRQNYVATEGQTTFAVQYDAPFVQVLTNGLLLPPGDYDASSGTEVVLNAGVSAGTEVTLIGLGAFQVADTWSKAEADTRYAEIAGGAGANFSVMPQVGGDPIVESGSNADGEWTRWSDGTQIVNAKIYPTITLSAAGSIFNTTISATFPVTFVGTVRTLDLSGNHAGGQGWGGKSSAGHTPTSGNFEYYSYVSVSGAGTSLTYAVIGRWK